MMWDQQGAGRLTPGGGRPLTGASQAEGTEDQARGEAQDERPERERPERERPERERPHADAQETREQRFPAPYGDALNHLLSDVAEDALDEEAAPTTSVMSDQFWLRLRARRVIREFLRAVPRTEPEAMLAFLNPDGEMRMVSRGELSAAIDRLRPRMRQIIRLSVEERWARARVCAFLHDISMKTFERDQMEGLDILTTL